MNLRRGLALAGVVCVLVAAAAVVWMGLRAARFETRRWVAAGVQGGGAGINARWAMFSDLVDHHDLRGMTWAEVCALLGPDDGGNCAGFDPARAGVKGVGSGPRSMGSPALGYTGPPPKCGKPPRANGQYSMFGGLAPHLRYTIRGSRLLWVLDHQTTYLFLIFCDAGTVDQWILEVND